MPEARRECALHILVVDDEANIRKTLTICLETDGHQVVAVSNARDAVNESSRRSFDLAFVDLRLGAQSGLDLIPSLLGIAPWLKIVVITAYASIETAVEAIKRGATDYIPKPFTPAQVKLAVDKASQLKSLEQRLAALQEDWLRANPEVDFGSTSPPMQRALSMAQQVATSDATVLLRGESGTGKSVMARAIHGWSPRAHRPMGTISCPALSAELLESELFGHVKGAFTGAVRDNRGRVAVCEGGTLLLDEIGDMPLSLQPKLLRFLQDKEYEPVGDNVTHRANVRVLAGTNVDLERCVKEGRFREDLFYRLNVIQIDLPPLRERPDDIVVLADRLLAFFGRGTHRTFLGFSDAALEVLRRYPWPGNIRELRNVVERATILCRADHIGIEHLPPSIAGSPDLPHIGGRLTLQDLEEQHIRRVLTETKSLQEAADVLGIDQATLWRRRKQYGI